MLGVLLNQVFIWPQVRRAVRTAEGIAALTVLGGLLARISWTAYGAVLGDVPLVVGNITVATGFLILLIVPVRRHRRPVVLMASGLGVATVVAVAMYAGSTVLAWLAVTSAAVVNLPQMVRALSDPARLAGVSVSTYPTDRRCLGLLAYLRCPRAQCVQGWLGPANEFRRRDELDRLLDQ